MTEPPPWWNTLSSHIKANSVFSCFIVYFTKWQDLCWLRSRGWRSTYNTGRHLAVPLTSCAASVMRVRAGRWWWWQVVMIGSAGTSGAVLLQCLITSWWFWCFIGMLMAAPTLIAVAFVRFLENYSHFSSALFSLPRLPPSSILQDFLGVLQD